MIPDVIALVPQVRAAETVGATLAVIEEIRIVAGVAVIGKKRPIQLGTDDRFV